MLFTVDKLTLILPLLVSPGTNQPRATDNPGLRPCFVKSRWLWCLRSFWHLTCILYCCSSSIYARVGYIAPVAFQGFFSSSEVFYSLPPFIFCSLPPPRRAKALRIANSPFPHLTSICRRGERQPWKLNSEYCQFHRPTGGRTISCKNLLSVIFLCR